MSFEWIFLENDVYTSNRIGYIININYNLNRLNLHYSFNINATLLYSTQIYIIVHY